MKIACTFFLGCAVWLNATELPRIRYSNESLSESVRNEVEHAIRMGEQWLERHGTNTTALIEGLSSGQCLVVSGQWTRDEGQGTNLGCRVSDVGCRESMIGGRDASATLLVCLHARSVACPPLKSIAHFFGSLFPSLPVVRLPCVHLCRLPYFDCRSNEKNSWV